MSPNGLLPSGSVTAWMFALNLAATWYMVGLIWMVQIVHYKMFDRVGEDGFARYAADHARLITPIVLLPMSVELLSAVGLVWAAPPGSPRVVLGIGLALVGVVWLSTALLQVPCHNLLSRGFQPDVYGRLVQTNWIRTIAWTTRGALMLWLLLQQLLPAGR